MSFSKRAFSRTFVLLDKRTQAVPSKPYWERLVTGGRVKEIAFTKNTTAVEIGEKLKDFFPSLAGSDLSRLEFIVSYSKGHSMKMVARGPQDGAKLVELFGGVRKKKVFLYFSSGTHNVSLSSSTSVASSSSQSTIPSTHNTSTLSSTTVIPSSTASATIFSTSTTSSTTSTTSSTASTISSTLASPTTSSTTSSITSTTPATHTMLIDLTTPPTGGVPTRRYLTALASVGGSSSDMYGDINSDESDDGVINNSIDILDSSDENSIDTQGAILNYGYVTDDFTTAGVVSDDHTILSRTSEVLHCSEMFKGDAGETAVFPFVTHTFEEICWQAYDDRRPIVVLLFNPLAPSQFRPTMHSFLQKMRNENKQDLYFWPAETTSKHGQRVVEKYGSGTDDQIIFLVPSTQQSPVVVDCIDGLALKDFDCARLCQRINNMIEGLSMKREQREQWRQLRREQEIELDQMALTSQHHNAERANTNVSEEEEQPEINVMEKENEKEIREARLARISQEPTHGHTIRVRTPTGVVSRKFGAASHYQEVYDWVGAQYEMPLHFTLHSCRDTNEDDVVILHGQLILADETINLTERDEQEVSTLLKDQVSFKGNYQGLLDLSKTTVDEGSNEKEADTAEETDGPNVENVKQKRKRKDNRAPKDRRKKQKKESKEVQD